MFKVTSTPKEDPPHGDNTPAQYTTLLAAWHDAVQRKAAGHSDVTIHRPAKMPPTRRPGQRNTQPQGAGS